MAAQLGELEQLLRDERDDQMHPDEHHLDQHSPNRSDTSNQLQQCPDAGVCEEEGPDTWLAGVVAVFPILCSLTTYCICPSH